MREITVALPVPYPIVIGRGLLAGAGERLKPWLPAGRTAALVSNGRIRRLHAATVAAGLASAGARVLALDMPEGERFKNLACVGDLAIQLAEQGADRDTLVVALGGGVVGDVAAFLASIYMRGVPVAQVPTTLVAMLDSAIGGKTGVNLPAGKNLVGTYHQPVAVLADPAALATLPDREFRSGLAEAIKCGVIRDAQLFAGMEARREEILLQAPDALEWLIAACAGIKAEVVAADEREGDLRRILNYGHTLGHALESATEYRHFLHGEAVAWGMIAANAIAVEMGWLRRQAAERIERLILQLCSPLPPIEVGVEAILEHATRDKKVRDGKMHFVLPREIGKVEVTSEVTAEAMRAAVRQILAQSKKGDNASA